jgi:4-amino-4-deoxy-L-arabinose transferase-like glycosyltransferase
MPEFTKTEAENPFQDGRTKWLLFAAVIVFVYMFGLNIPLLGPDEPRYAQVAREMFERGDWVTPTLGGHHWFEKPALLYWLQIASYNLFGVTEFAARFGSALFGLGTIFSLWILGRAAAGRPDFANWLALIAASTLGIIVFSRGASFDIILTFPMTASLVGFFIFDLRNKSGSRNELLPLALFYVFIGVSLLAKGLIGIVFPFAIVSFYYVLSWKFPSRKFIVSLIWGTLIAAVVASTWYLPMYLRHGYEFIDEFFIQHHFQRYTSNKYFHPQPFYFFLWVLPLMTIPWLPFFIAALWRSVLRLVGGSNVVSQGPDSNIRSDLKIFCFAWAAVPLVFFSFSGSKLPGYILPAVPPLIIFTAGFVYRWMNDSRSRRLVIQGIAFGTFAAVVLAMVFVVPKFADSDSVKGLIATANERGFERSSVLSLHNVSHNAEFYAAGRIVRDTTGKQKKFLGPAEVLEGIRREGHGSTVLVLVPLEYLDQATDSRYFAADVIKDNGELAIVAVRAK